MPFDWPSSVEPALRRLSPGQLHLPQITPEDVKLPKRGSAHFGIISVVLLVAAVILFLLIFDWNWFRPPLARIASDRLNREVAIQGDLDVHPWSLSPRAEVHGLRIGKPAWEGAGEMIEVDRIAIRIKDRIEKANT